MSELQITGIMFYLLIGLFIADTIMVKVDGAYWFTLLFWPILLFILLLAGILLFLISLVFPRRFTP